MTKKASLGQQLRMGVQKGLWKLGFHGAAPDRPSTLMVEPTNACNLKCPACPTGAGTLNRPPRAMTFDEFKSILDQALAPPGYLKQVTLFNYGEPFLCKDFLKMVRYAADHGLDTFTSTNGHFFGSDERAAAVVESGLSELLVCLDGADQETIGRYRKNSNLDEILDGIRRVLAARAKAGKANPLVELQFIVMKHNEHQCDLMREIARDLGVDRFVEKTVGINPTDPNFQTLARELLPEDLSKSRYERLADGSIRIQGEAPCGCDYINSTLVVNSNGDIVPCCYDIHSDHVMGNVFEQPLAGVWLGEKFQTFRKRVRASRANVPICRHCPDGRVTMRTVEDVDPSPMS